MIVTPQEYSALLEKVKDPNTYSYMLRVPKDEPVYDINLNTRKISVPSFLSVVEDHNSEIVWFKTDRFFDNIDLYDSTCWIKYRNANGEEFFFFAPLLIELDEFGTEKLLIPWVISKYVSAAEGMVEFSFQFFKLSEDGLRILYMLNTLSAKAKIMSTLDINLEDYIDDSTVPQRDWLANELQTLTAQYARLSKDYEMFWIEAD